MKQKSVFSIQRFGVIVLCALFAWTAASPVAAGQSGRRVPKKPSTPDPLPPAQSEPPIVVAEPKEEKGIPVLVVRYLPFIHNSNIAASIVIDGFMDRMRASNAVRMRAGKEMNRKEASDYAKASSDTYVVLIQLDVDSSYNDRTPAGYENPYSLYVEYSVFAPTTGKSKSSGRVYQRRGGIGGGRIPGTTAGAEYSLRNAGRETADRVLNALGLNLIHRN
jgi:hypothetical protein